VQGMDIIKQILVAPISPTKGEGGMKGQMLENPVPITSAKRA
jgi:peptidyl-prolyl cis-trans isomerase A (cyclophilin A)